MSQANGRTCSAGRLISWLAASLWQCAMHWMAERGLDEGDSFSSDAVTQRLPGTASARRRPPLAITLGPTGRTCRQDLKNVSIEHLDDLRAKAKYARERYRLYKAKAYGPRDTSAARLREFQRVYEQAEARLRAAEAEECRARNAGASPPSLS